MSLLFFLKPVYRYLSAMVTVSPPVDGEKVTERRKKKKEPARLVPDLTGFASDILKKAEAENLERLEKNRDAAVARIERRIAALFATLEEKERERLAAITEQKRRYRLMVELLAKAKLAEERKKKRQEQEDQEIIAFLMQSGLI